MRRRREIAAAFDGRERRAARVERSRGGAARAECLDGPADLLEQCARGFLRAAGARGRQDAAGCDRRGARGGGFLPLLCAAGAQRVHRRARASKVRPASSNELSLHGRGVFACISPWNFPLAIFAGQVTAALAAGNAVVAKPAEPTPLIAARFVRLLHEAGVRARGAAARTGAGPAVRRGGVRPCRARRRRHDRFDRDRAHHQPQRWRRASGAIVPLIAETGGLNAMLVDSTALPEQVVDDVVTSAFMSAGQRCSALRLLFLQEEIADTMLEMIVGRDGRTRDRRSRRFRRPTWAR